MASRQRTFTRVDDEWILRQSRGEISIQELRYRLRMNLVSIKRRAGELGVAVKVLPRTPNTIRRKMGPMLSSWDDLTPARIRNDRLLARLIEIHGDPDLFVQRRTKHLPAQQSEQNEQQQRVGPGIGDAHESKMD